MQDFRKLNVYLTPTLPLPLKGREIVMHCPIPPPSRGRSGGGWGICRSNAKCFLYYGLLSSYAYRFVNEVLTCLELSVELKLVKNGIEIEDLTNEGIELSKMIYGFSKKLKT